MMKICITARGKTLDSAFECHFARAPFFIFHDSGTGKTEAVRNGFVISDTRIGQNAVRLLKTNGLDAVITGEIGENARALLKGSDISLYLHNGSGPVRKAIHEFLRSRAEEVPGGPGYPH